MGVANTIRQYVNGLVGFLPGRRVMMTTFKTTKGELLVKVEFTRLINLEEVSLEGFVPSDTKRVIQREHSKWAILESEIIMSTEAMEMLEAMTDRLHEINPIVNYLDD